MSSFPQTQIHDCRGLKRLNSNSRLDQVNLWLQRSLLSGWGKCHKRLDLWPAPGLRTLTHPAFLLEALPVNSAFPSPVLARHAEMLGGQSWQHFYNFGIPINCQVAPSQQEMRCKRKGSGSLPDLYNSQIILTQEQKPSLAFEREDNCITKPHSTASRLFSAREQREKSKHYFTLLFTGG